MLCGSRRAARHFGEAVQALRQKINGVELYIRDEYVRRDSFYSVKEDLQGAIEKLGDDIGDRLDKLEKKIDNGKVK